MSAVRRPSFEPALLRSELLEIRSVDQRQSADKWSAVSGRNAVRNLGQEVTYLSPGATAPVAPPAWWLQAACRGRPTSWWYPAKGDSFAFAVAKSVCSSCSVKAQCLDDALAFEADSGFSAGVRGGLTAERRAIMLGRRLSR